MRDDVRDRGCLTSKRSPGNVVYLTSERAARKTTWHVDSELERIASFEENVASRHKSAKVDHFGQYVRELFFGGDEYNLNPAMNDQPAKIVLPA